MEKKIIIIPDVHGRDFWREAVKNMEEDTKVVFLGDYLDPYPHENIDRDESFNNFLAIIAFKEANMDKVTLLAGNHDRHYFPNYSPYDGFGRKSSSIAARCTRMKLFDLPYFEIVHEENVADIRFVFSHAGIRYDWYRNMIDRNSEKVDLEKIRSLYEQNPVQAFDNVYSRYRGLGGGKYGSPVWADAREFAEEREYDKDIVQIFGHTQLDGPVMPRDGAYCLDCRRYFYIDELGRIIDSATDRPVGEENTKEEENGKQIHN